MKHIVLFKFKRNENLKKISKILIDTYDELKNKHNVIKSYEFKVNCMDLEANMDIILFVDLGDSYVLENYINHPVHKDFVATLKEEGLTSKSAIDVEN